MYIYYAISIIVISLFTLYNNQRGDIHSMVTSSSDMTNKVILFDNESLIEKLKMDFFILKETNLKDDNLSLVVTYSGGCKKHEFVLAAAPNFANSNLKKINLILSHDNKGDMCKKIVRDSLNFDLLPLKEKFQQNYGKKEGTMILHLKNKDIQYDFLK